MSKNLVIVESPAKAKTIEGFLGKDYTVKSSFGHIRDLPGKNISIDIENDFKPEYVISDDKKKVVAELKKLVKDADIVWLATDEDREGEAISWHLKEALNLKDENIRRIVFHEITKNAITKAIENPRSIDENLVNAQQARRVLDRLVGYELSPILWKKVKPSLSAGRVQSVTVRLIVEREREIMNFQSQDFYKVVGIFQSKDGKTFKAEVSSRFKSYEEAKSFLDQCAAANFSVGKVEKKPATKSPAAPFTTSTLQQEASRKLGFSVSQTMVVAQKLYESGKITYMRTDSVNLSDLAVNSAKSYISSEYGADYSNPRQYSTKSKGAQEAHEAIRPTELSLSSIGSSTQEARLYDLIWKRTIASQMSNAKIERTNAQILVSGADNYFSAKGEIITFEGFLKVYLESTDEEEDEEQTEGLLPNFKEGDGINMQEITSTQRFTKHPARYQEASLVKKLEELGIGRPSTYAPTISTIQKRGYVIKESRDGEEREYLKMTLSSDGLKEEKLTENTGAEKNKLFPTAIGMVVTDFLSEHFTNIMDYSFTADVEKQFDEIAEGQRKWNQMIESFYTPFHNSVEHTLEHADRAKGERELGVDPDSGKPVFARIGRYGAMVQIGQAEDEEKPKFASLLKGQNIETISLEEALELFKLPRTLGEFEGEEIQAAIGRFGPYVRWGKLFASLKKNEGDDPFTIELDRAIELVKEKQEQEKNKYIKTFDEDKDVQVLNGRYGPYIKIGRKNFKIPKDKKPEELTLEECRQIAEAAPAKKRGARKTTKSKSKSKS
ncbi:MAG: DNA topoisomerase I [Flavobacteriales bacterium]|nr:DNA topoisomerase I [Flavobacteriales bacterium]